MAACRNRLVPDIIAAIKPDVILLQETRTDKLIDEIIRRLCPKTYEQVCASDTKESRILYNSVMYFNISQEKIFRFNDCTSYDALDYCINSTFPQEIYMQYHEIFHRRLSCVCLRRKWDPVSVPERAIIFMSFHNVYNSIGASTRIEAGEGFCKIVDQLQKMTGATVIAGADLNFDCSLRVVSPIILPYQPTLRRIKRKFDFILMAPPTYRGKVEALDFVEAESDDSNPLYGVVKELLRPDANGFTYTISDYCRAVNHDPLVLNTIVYFAG